MSVDDEESLRRELVAQYRRSAELRLNDLSSGNLSCRCGEGMLISPTGASAETISADSVVYVAADGEWRGEHAPSSEWRMHAAVYRRYAEAPGLRHPHSDHCLPLPRHHHPLP